MKKYFMIIIPVVFIGVCSMFIFSFSLFNENDNDFNRVSSNIIKVSDKENKTEMDSMKSCCSEETMGNSVADKSIYQLNSNWTNQNNKVVKLENFKGKNVVMTMFFASCTYACPILVNDMQKIEASIPKDKLNDYKFVLVSIDPERDSPQTLRQYAKAKGLDTNRWTLLTGDKDEVMELAALIGFKYKQTEDGNFSHTNLITLLNRKGEIIHQNTGLNQDLTAVTELVKN